MTGLLSAYPNAEGNETKVFLFFPVIPERREPENLMLSAGIFRKME